MQGGLKASAARLDATRTGRELGDRTLMDVLNAENDHARATLALAEARTSQVQQRLRLAALADRLDEPMMGQINAALAPARADVAPTAPPAVVPRDAPARAPRKDRR